MRENQSRGLCKHIYLDERLRTLKKRLNLSITRR